MFSLTHLVDLFSFKVNVEALKSVSSLQNQLLNFAVLFCMKPKLVLLAGATNSVPAAVVEQVYGECNRLAITYVTISNDESLHKYHQIII